MTDFEKRIILFENKTCLISANSIPSHSEVILKLLLVNFSNFLSFYKQLRQSISHRLVPVSRPLLKVLQLSKIPICSELHRPKS